jgi:hypothetical protein
MPYARVERERERGQRLAARGHGQREQSI